MSTELDCDVEFRNVTKRFGSVRAVDGVNLKVRKGEFLSLLGPSGCGKTTSLRLIAGFEQPDEGEILIGGVNQVGTPPYKRAVNTVFQQYALFPHMSVLDNVGYGLKQRKVAKAERHRLVAEALSLVRLEPLLPARAVHIAPAVVAVRPEPDGRSHQEERAVEPVP